MPYSVQRQCPGLCTWYIPHTAFALHAGHAQVSMYISTWASKPCRSPYSCCRRRSKRLSRLQSRRLCICILHCGHAGSLHTAPVSSRYSSAQASLVIATELRLSCMRKEPHVAGQPPALFKQAASLHLDTHSSSTLGLLSHCPCTDSPEPLSGHTHSKHVGLTHPSLCSSYHWHFPAPLGGAQYQIDSKDRHGSASDMHLVGHGSVNIGTPGNSEPLLDALGAEAVHAARHQPAVLDNACKSV